MRALVMIAVAACGGGGDPPASLVEVAAIPDVVDQLDDRVLAFDSDNTLVLADTSNLRRLNGTRLDIISNTQVFAAGTLGVAGDGKLLVSSQQSVILGLVAGNQVSNISPAPPSQNFRPVGTPAGSIFIETFNANFLLSQGVWAETTLDLTRTHRAADGRLFAIIDGDIVEIGANDAVQPIASCAGLGGALCGNLVLGGLDATGRMYMAGGIASFQILEPTTGALSDFAMPGGLAAQTIVAGTAMIVILAIDPARQNERSLWLVDPDTAALQRIATLPAGKQRLIADRDGNAFIAGNGLLHAVTLN